MKRILSLCTLAVLVALPAFAQTAYMRTPGETLRYKETTEQEQSIVSPQFEQDAKSTSEGIFTVTFAEADTVRAAFESLDVQSDTPMGKQDVNMMDMMTGGYLFTMQDDGSVETIETPTVTEGAPGGNIAGQFNNFFLKLPDEPLAMGTTWTTTRETEAQPGVTSTVESTYTVTGEEERAGMDVFVISLEGTNVIDGETSQMGQTAIVSLKGTQQGTYYFSKDGIMVGAEVTTAVKGGIDVEANGEQMMIDQTSDSVTRIELLTD
ncbi:MAG: DUF6263 family protein [Bacteroidota bacterium]